MMIFIEMLQLMVICSSDTTLYVVIYKISIMLTLKMIHSNLKLSAETKIYMVICSLDTTLYVVIKLGSTLYVVIYRKSIMLLHRNLHCQHRILSIYLQYMYVILIKAYNFCTVFSFKSNDMMPYLRVFGEIFYVNIQ